MASELLVLAFDTSAAHCAAALLRGDTVLAARAKDMGRGQAENLMPLLEDILQDVGATWADLDRIGVGVGPGNFTGIRISVSAARGLALGLGIPALGVSTFDAISMDQEAPHLPAVPGPREKLYVRPLGAAPELVTREAAEAFGLPILLPPAPAELAVRIAHLSATASDTEQPPAPLYVKPADAAPPRDPAPVILDVDA